MPRPHALGLRTLQRTCEIRRIGDYRVKPHTGFVGFRIGADDLHTAAPRACLYVFRGLAGGVGIQFDSGNAGDRIPLGRHQRNKPCPGPNVKDRRRILQTGPCSQQHAVRPHLHRAPVVADLELFKLKIWIRHTIVLKNGQKYKSSSKLILLIKII